MEAILAEVERLLSQLKTEHGVSASIIGPKLGAPTSEPSSSLGIDLITEALDHVWALPDAAGENSSSSTWEKQEQDEMRRNLQQACKAIKEASNLLVKTVTVGRIDDCQTTAPWRLANGQTWQDDLLYALKRWPGINLLVLGVKGRSPPISYEVLEKALAMAAEGNWPKLRNIHMTVANSHSTSPLPANMPSCSHLITKLCATALGNVTDLSSMSSLTRLEDLKINACASFSSILFLPSLAASLKALHLTFLAVSDLQPLSSLARLECLTIGWSPITNVSPIWCCQALTSLEVTHCQDVKTIEGVSRCPQLESLALENLSLDLSSLVQVANCSLIKKLVLKSPLDTGLVREHESLAVQLSRLRHIESIALDESFADEDIRSLIPGLSQGLKELTLRGHRSLLNQTLTPVSLCAQLEVLDLESTSISDLSPLSGTDLPRLKKLNISSTGVTSLVSLSFLLSLEDLQCSNLRSYSFSTLDPLSSCTRLTSLDFSNSVHIDDLRALSNCRHLVHLKCDGCYGIRSLKPLHGLTALRSLSLMRVSRIRDLSPLAQCIELREIKMSHCESLKGISHLSNLKFLELKMIGKWHESGPTDDEMDEAHPDDDSPNHLWDEGDGGWDEEDEGGFGEEQEGGWDEEDGGFDEHVDQEWPDDYDFDDEEGQFEEDPFEGIE